MAPLAGGGFADMRETADTPASGAFTAHLMNPALEQAYFTAFHPEQEVVFGYVWRRADFPWLGIWEENYCRGQAPWNGETLTRAMEFGVSPMPETRREMVARGRMFGEKCYGWLPARSETTVEYCLFIAESQAPVEAVVWADGVIRRAGATDIPAA